jgi:hypothetical protein
VFAACYFLFILIVAVLNILAGAGGLFWWSAITVIRFESYGRHMQLKDTKIQSDG